MICNTEILKNSSPYGFDLMDFSIRPAFNLCLGWIIISTGIPKLAEVIDRLTNPLSRCYCPMRRISQHANPPSHTADTAERRAQDEEELSSQRINESCNMIYN